MPVRPAKFEKKPSHQFGAKNQLINKQLIQTEIKLT
jgi:hypothetical protein